MNEIVSIAEYFVLQAFYVAEQSGRYHPPTIREICNELQRSVATIQQHVNRLHGAGYLRKRIKARRVPRNYVLTAKGKAVFVKKTI